MEFAQIRTPTNPTKIRIEFVSDVISGQAEQKRRERVAGLDERMATKFEPKVPCLSINFPSNEGPPSPGHVISMGRSVCGA